MVQFSDMMIHLQKMNTAFYTPSAARHSLSFVRQGRHPYAHAPPWCHIILSSAKVLANKTELTGSMCITKPQIICDLSGTEMNEIQIETVPEYEALL
jgi:hypothetical protein